MNITDNTKSAPRRFTDLKIGDPFTYGGILYMKATYSGSATYAVNLKTGQIDTFGEAWLVSLSNVEVVIT